MFVSDLTDVLHPKGSAYPHSVCRVGGGSPGPPPRAPWDEVEAGADDPLALEQLTFTEVLERVDEHGDLFTV